MKVFAISDLHLSTSCNKPMDIFGKNWNNYVEQILENWNKKVSPDDIVLLCGDFSWAMTFEDAQSDFDLIAPLSGKKILIRGNHDYWWKSINKLRENVPSNFFLLQNDSLKFENIIFCGSRLWSISDDNSAEDNKILARETERMKLSLANAQKNKKTGDKLVVMTHYPPFNQRFAPNELTQMFRDNDVNAVVYGHLHGKDCAKMPVIIKDRIPYYLTSCDLIGHNPLQIEI